MPWVCGLLDSEHTVMTNEGLVALNLLATLNNGEYLHVSVANFNVHTVSSQSEAAATTVNVSFSGRGGYKFESGAY